MERLHAAIEKARKDQTGPSSRIVGGRSGRDADDKWQALPRQELSAKDLQRNRIYTVEATQEAVAFDILRTRTLRYMQKMGWKRLAITSPTASCGKSTISLNLAFAMARQAKTRTVQMEIDMRRPSQHKLLGLQKSGRIPSGGVGALFSGEVDFSAVSWRYGDRLAMTTNEKPVGNASDLLLGNTVADVLHEIEDSYQPDIMIFDMPPMLVNDDTLAFQQHVDCALLVAAAEQSTAAEIDRCERELAAQTNFLGVVLNKCRLHSNDGRYGYDYSYGY